MDARERNERGITVDRIKLLLLGLGLTSTMVGCAADTDSENVRTRGVRADFEVLASSVQQGGETSLEDIDVRADLRVDDDESNTWLDLTGEDELIITADDETRTQTGDERTTHFPGTEGELDFNFAFMRGDEDDSAPASTVTLPPLFEVQGMEGVDGADPVISRAALELHLEGLDNEEVTYSIEGDANCLKDRSGEITANNGDITIPASAFEAWDDAATEPCGSKLYVEVVNQGSLDPAYNEGRIRAIRRVWVPFVSAP